MKSAFRIYLLVLLLLVVLAAVIPISLPQPEFLPLANGPACNAIRVGSAYAQGDDCSSCQREFFCATMIRMCEWSGNWYTGCTDCTDAEGNSRCYTCSWT